MNIETFKKLFTVDPTPRTEKVGDSYTGFFHFEKLHNYNINNRQVVESGSVVEEGKLRDYLNEVVFLLYDTLKPSEILDFLDYHYQNSTEKTMFLKFVKYDLWELWPINRNDTIFQNRKNVINDWLAEQKAQPQTNKPLPTLEEMFIDKKRLTKLVEVLIEKGFVAKGVPFWLRKPVEFVAMAEVCGFLLQEPYRENGLQKHSAWTSYFKHRTKEQIVSNQYFKAAKQNEVYKHRYKFNFIKEYFDTE